jgi:DNA-binding response OmpR family regulator
LVVVTSDESGYSVLAALADLHHQVRSVNYEVNALFCGPSFDAVLVDARDRACQSRAYAQSLQLIDLTAPVLAVFTAGGLVTLSRDWAISDLLLDDAGPAEVEARLRVAIQRHRRAGLSGSGQDSPQLVLDESTSTCVVAGEKIDLTYVQFRLLSVLASHPDRTFSRDGLRTLVWQHSRRPPAAQSLSIAVRGLRAALGRHAPRIRTVRGVGYTYSADPSPRRAASEAPGGKAQRSGIGEVASPE